MLESENTPASPGLFAASDPVARLLLRLGAGRTPAAAALVALFLDAVGIGGGGALISWQHSNAHSHFLPIYDVRQLAVVLFVYGLAIPFVWLCYIADLNAIPVTFEKLTQNRVIIEQAPDSDGKRQPVDLTDILRRQRGLYNHWWNVVVVLLITVGVAWLVFLSILAPAKDDSFRLGYSADMVWWSVNRIYLSFVWAPITFSAIYMISWMICRRIITTSLLGQIYQKYRVVPIVLCPDGANGLGPVGDFAMRFLWLVFLGACWLSFFVFLPVLFGFPPNVKMDIVVYIVGYLLFVQLLLIGPVWRTHVVMTSARTRILAAVAGNINDILLASEYSIQSAASESDGQISEAEVRRRKYQLIREQVGTWPFARPALIRNLLGALAPLIPALVSFAFQNLSKFVSLSVIH